MGDNQHGHPLPCQLRHYTEHLPDHFGVQRTGRFIKQHGGGMHGQCAGNGRTLLLSAGKLCRKLVGLILYAYPFKQLHRFPARSRLSLSQHIPRCQAQVFKDRHVRKKIKGLEHHPDPGTHPCQFTALLRNRLSLNPDFTGINRLQPVNRPAQGRLSRTGGPDNHHNLSPVNRERNIPEHVERPKMLVHMPQFNDRNRGFHQDRLLSALTAALLFFAHRSESRLRA